MSEVEPTPAVESTVEERILARFAATLASAGGDALAVAEPLRARLAAGTPERDEILALVREALRSDGGSAPKPRGLPEALGQGGDVHGR